MLQSDAINLPHLPKLGFEDIVALPSGSRVTYSGKDGILTVDTIEEVYTSESGIYIDFNSGYSLWALKGKSLANGKHQAKIH